MEEEIPLYPGAEGKRKNSYKKDMDKIGCINNFISVKTHSGYHGNKWSILHRGMEIRKTA